MGIWIDKLVERLDRTSIWPTGPFKKVGEEIGVWIAFRESERAKLKLDHPLWKDTDRYYQIDPLAPKISDAFASLLFGRRPVLTPAKESDAKRLDEIAEDNGFPAQLQRAVRTSSSEGEVWWRIKADPDLAEVPLVEWYSRTAVFPLWIGPRLAACAFVSRYDTDDIEQKPTATVFRHFEIHERGEVQNILFEGTKSTLGQQVPLTRFSETADLEEQWAHGLPAMLAGRVPNTEGVDPTLGVSDYFRIKDMLHDVNEGLTIGAENARMTLKQRMVAPASAFDEEGNLRDQEVWSAESLDSEMPDETGGSQLRVLEYDFKAQQILEWRRGLAEDGLGRIGIVAQFVGAGSTQEGLAVSGTALKVRLIPTTAAGDERGQFWDDKRTGLPGILAIMQMLDELSLDEGGFGVKWADATTPPSMERGSTLPEDETEIVDRNAAAVQGQIRSRRVAIEEQHPDWSEKQVEEEEDRIRRDMQDSRPLTGIFDQLPGSGNNGQKKPGEGEGDGEGEGAEDGAGQPA
jgi:hypothetical protein